MSARKIIQLLLPNERLPFLKPLKYGLPDHERVVSNHQLKSNIF